MEQQDPSLNRQEGEYIELDYRDLEAFILGELNPRDHYPKEINPRDLNHTKEFFPVTRETTFPRDSGAFSRDFSSFRDSDHVRVVEGSKDYIQDRLGKEYSVKETDSLLKSFSVEPLVKNFTLEPLVKDYSLDPLVKDYSMDVLVKDYSMDPSVKDYSMDPSVKNYSMDPLVKNYLVEAPGRHFSSEPQVKNYSLEPLVKDYRLKDGGANQIKTYSLEEIDALNMNRSILQSVGFSEKDYTVREITVQPLSVSVIKDTREERDRIR